MTQTYAVIFSSERADIDGADYEEMANRMVELAKNQNGFLGLASVRDSRGFGITISYWESLADIQSWKQNSEHLNAQHLGKSRWYKSFKTKICKVEREYEYGKS